MIRAIGESVNTYIHEIGFFTKLESSIYTYAPILLIYWKDGKNSCYIARLQFNVNAMELHLYCPSPDYTGPGLTYQQLYYEDPNFLTILEDRLCRTRDNTNSGICKLWH